MRHATLVTSEALGARLAAARHARSWTLSDVERETGGRFKRGSLHYYEHGARTISAVRLAELARIYGKSPASFLEPEAL